MAIQKQLNVQHTAVAKEEGSSGVKSTEVCTEEVNVLLKTEAVLALPLILQARVVEVKVAFSSLEQTAIP